MGRGPVLVAVLALLVVSAGCLGGTGSESSGEATHEVRRAEDSGIPPNESPVLLPTDKESIEFVNINISADDVAPVDARGEQREMVRWRNTNEFPVYLSFAWMDSNRTIEPGESGSMLLSGQTSYRVYRNDTGEFIAEGTVAIR